MIPCRFVFDMSLRTIVIMFWIVFQGGGCWPFYILCVAVKFLRIDCLSEYFLLAVDFYLKKDCFYVFL